MNSTFTRYPLTAGDKRVISIAITDASGAAVNITGWDVKFAMWGGAVNIEKTATLTTPASGLCTVTIDPADTSAVTVQTVCQVEIQATPPGDGPFTILRDVRWTILPQKITP